MVRRWSWIVLGAVTLLCGTGADWLQFRGNSYGVAPAASPPLEWSVPDNKNVAWQVDLPGRGPSSPIVVEGRVIVTASGGANQDRLHVLCFEASSGKRLWERQFWATGRTASHPSSANAAPSPCSDGQRIFAFYSSNDLVCLDLEGNLLWYRGLTFDYPKAGNDVGMSSSPVVVDGVVVVQVENQGDSFAAGLDAETGETRWRQAREPNATWTSPAALPARGVQPGLVLLQSASALTAHDPLTGAEVWRQDVTCDLIPSPVIHGDRTLFVSSDQLTMLRHNAASRGVETVWGNNRLKPGAASPILADATTGDVLWQLRLKGEFWATPVVVDKYLYLLSQDGTAQVVELADQEGRIVATNPVGEKLQASAAIVGDSVFVRSDSHLWRFAEDAAQ
jgi:outer membrane protein assembly factor BamB